LGKGDIISKLSEVKVNTHKNDQLFRSGDTYVPACTGDYG